MSLSILFLLQVGHFDLHWRGGQTEEMVHLTTGQRPTAAGESHANGRGGYIVVRGQDWECGVFNFSIWYRSVEGLIFALNQRWGSKDGERNFNLSWANEGAKMQTSLIFGDAISEFEKRYRIVLSGNISLHGQMFGFAKSKGKIMACFVLNMCELMKGAQYCEFFYSLQNLYVSITQTLDNIKLRCNHGLQTFRTIRQKKKRWNSTNSICFL